MHTRLTRFIDWSFDGSGRVPEDLHGAPRAESAPALPRAEDRAKYDRGAAFFGS
jgi:hypothetical protein